MSLVTPGEGREDTRARAVYPEQDEAIAAVIDKFSAADARLLVTGEDAPSTRRLVEISHEAMIREWDLLKTWIESNRDALRRREHIRARLRQWEEQGRDRTLLLPPGLPLEEGRKLLADHGDVLIDEMQPYIGASLAADEERQRQAEAAAEAERQRELAAARQRVRFYQAIAGAMIVALLATAGGWMAWRHAQEAIARLGQAIDIAASAVNRAVRLGDRGIVEEMLVQADASFTQLIQEGTASPPLRSRMALLLMVLADHYGIIGKAERQLDAAKRARDILAALVADDPSQAEWQQQLAISHDLVGDALANELQMDAALSAYRSALSIREKLAARRPADPSPQRSIGNFVYGP